MIQLEWQPFIDYVQQYLPKASQSLAPPSTNEQITTVEKQMNFSFPLHLKEIYLLHNGQSNLKQTPIHLSCFYL